MMKVSEKQEKVERFVWDIRYDVLIEFDNSKRCKTMLASLNKQLRRIRFRRPLWGFTLDSCKHTALHELAHLEQWERHGHTEHSKGFQCILNELMTEYGTPEIEKSNRSRRIAISNFTKDDLVEWDI